MQNKVKLKNPKKHCHHQLSTTLLCWNAEWRRDVAHWKLRLEGGDSCKCRHKPAHFLSSWSIQHCDCKSNRMTQTTRQTAHVIQHRNLEDWLSFQRPHHAACIEGMQREQMSVRPGWDSSERRSHSSRVSSAPAGLAMLAQRVQQLLQYLSRQAEKTVGGMRVTLLPVV